MKYTCLNPIASVGLDQFTEGYEKTEKMEDADAVLVRSAAMHDLELPDCLLAVARAGAGVNNIPLDKCAEKGIELRIADRWYPSSRRCHNCGQIRKDLKLSNRVYQCSCGYCEDRDLNAALNLRDVKTYQSA